MILKDQSELLGLNSGFEIINLTAILKRNKTEQVKIVGVIERNNSFPQKFRLIYFKPSFMKQPQNYLALIPVRKITEIKEVDGIITLMLPKFKNEKFRKWFIQLSVNRFYSFHERIVLTIARC